MNKTIPLVKIKDPSKDGDYLLIEESCFNDKLHFLFDENSEKEEKIKRTRAKKEEI